MKRKDKLEIIKYLQDHGVTVLEFNEGRKHNKLRVTDGARFGLVICSDTCSDWRRAKNILSDAKRSLAQARDR